MRHAPDPGVEKAADEETIDTDEYRDKNKRCLHAYHHTISRMSFCALALKKARRPHLVRYASTYGPTEVDTEVDTVTLLSPVYVSPDSRHMLPTLFTPTDVSQMVV